MHSFMMLASFNSNKNKVVLTLFFVINVCINSPEKSGEVVEKVKRLSNSL